MFKALMLSREGKTVHAAVTELDESTLGPGDVTVRVEYSTLNFKDGLAITGRGAIVKNWPLIAGIDLAGTVESSESRPCSDFDCTGTPITGSTV